MANEFALREGGLDRDPLGGSETQGRGMAAPWFGTETSLFSASFAPPDRAPLPVQAGPPATRASTQGQPPARGRGSGAAGVAGRGKKATTKAEPSVGADTPPRASSRDKKETDVQVMMELLQSMQVSMSGMPNRVVALEGSQTVATAGGSASTRQVVEGLPPLPGTTLHFGDRPPPPPPPKMGGVGLTVPLLDEQHSALLSSVRTAHPVPDSRTGRTAAKASSFSKAGALKPAVLDEEEAVDVGAGEGSLAAAMQLLCQNQAALTSLLADRETASSSLSSSSSALDGVSLKGPGLLLKQRRKFATDPLGPWTKMNARVPELLSLEEGESWSTDKYAREHVAFGHHRLAKRLFYLLCRMHRAAEKEDFNTV